jgi:hypothetical protein
VRLTLRALKQLVVGHSTLLSRFSNCAGDIQIADALQETIQFNLSITTPAHGRDPRCCCPHIELSVEESDFQLARNLMGRSTVEDEPASILPSLAHLSLLGERTHVAAGVFNGTEYASIGSAQWLDELGTQVPFGQGHSRFSEL